MVDIYQLRMRQAMSLKDKIRFTERRIIEWVEEFGEDGVYISFSGGKDSTVLLDIARKLYPNLKAMFVDTGLEYPEIRQFVKTFDNVDILRPQKRFDQVIQEYGYPIISKEVSEFVSNSRKCIESGFTKYLTHYNKLTGKYLDKNGKKSPYCCDKWKFLLKAPFKISNKCCSVMKKKPSHDYQKQTGRNPIIATMAEESRLRTAQYLRQGCNGFNNKIPTSTPMAFWTEQDVLQYLYENEIPYASVYGKLIKNTDNTFSFTGCQRTGCMFCGYGCHLEKEPNRFQKLKLTHPKQYDYIMNKLGFKEVLDFIKVDY